MGEICTVAHSEARMKKLSLSPFAALRLSFWGCAITGPHYEMNGECKFV